MIVTSPTIKYLSGLGREIFVGLSTRTNLLGAQAVGKAFPEYPTVIVKVNPPAVHLKDYISMAGPEVMTIGKSEAAQKTFQVIVFFPLLHHGIRTTCPGIKSPWTIAP